MITVDAYMQIGKILDTLLRNKFVIGRMKMCRMSTQQAQQFLGEKRCTCSERSAVFA